MRSGAVSCADACAHDDDDARATAAANNDTQPVHGDDMSGRRLERSALQSRRCVQGRLLPFRWRQRHVVCAGSDNVPREALVEQWRAVRLPELHVFVEHVGRLREDVQQFDHVDDDVDDNRFACIFLILSSCLSSAWAWVCRYDSVTLLGNLGGLRCHRPMWTDHRRVQCTGPERHVSPGR